jgi:trans-aconitate methyltransferase
MSATVELAYLLSHDWELEPRRLELLERICDPVSTRRLAATGVGEGWRCLEVGAGRGSIAGWLGQRVGSSGHVIALDLDTGLLEQLEQPGFEIRRGDVLEEEFPPESLDLVHMRAVLMHIPERHRAIERIVQWLRPGGWLVVEEPDWMAVLANPDQRFVDLFRAYQDALPTMDFGCGSAMPSELTAAGLGELAVDVDLHVVDGTSEVSEWLRLSCLALRERVLEAGTTTAEEIDAMLERMVDPTYRAFGWSWVGVGGRRFA